MRNKRTGKGYKVRVYVTHELQRDFGKGKTKHPYKTREGAEARMQELKKVFRKQVPEAKYSVVCSK